MSEGKVLAVNISAKKGTRKSDVGEVYLKPDWGIEGDAHAGIWPRQVSFLAQESIDKMRAKGLEVGPGDFAENITTAGVDWPNLPVGTIVAIGEEVLLAVTQIGKECHTRCAIYYAAGDCVMPREGVFGRVVVGGHVRVGDQITVELPRPVKEAV